MAAPASRGGVGPSPVAAAVPASPAAGGGAGLSRSDVRDALLRLVVNDAFIDMLHAELSRKRGD